MTCKTEFDHLNWHDSSITSLEISRLEGKPLRITMQVNYIVSYETVIARTMSVFFVDPQVLRGNWDGLCLGRDVILTAREIRDSQFKQERREFLEKIGVRGNRELFHYEFGLNSGSDIEIVCGGYEMHDIQNDSMYAYYS